jgi:tetratricopeptide (TPR) repeat protein
MTSRDPVSNFAEPINNLNDVSSVLRHVDALARQGNVAAALKTVSLALDFNPDDAALYRWMSNTFLKEGASVNAKAWAELAIEVSPEDSRNQILLAKIYDRNGQVDLMEAALQRAVLLNPSDGSTLRRLSIVLQSRQSPQAIDYAYRAVEVNPTDENFQRHLISLLFVQGDLDAIERALSKALAILPRNAVLLRRLSELHLKRKDHALAIVWAERAAQEAPEDGGTQFALASLLLTANDLPAARKAIENAVRATPNTSRYLRRLSEIALKQRDFPAALSAVSKAIVADQKDVLNLQHLALIYIEQGDFNAAELAIRDAIGLAPLASAPKRRLSEINRRRGELDSALFWSQAAIDADPTDASNFSQQATILQALRRFPDAHTALCEAIRLAPKNESYHQRIIAIESRIKS